MKTLYMHLLMRMEQSPLIEKKEVVQLKIPYPDIHSGLAKKLHMYICVKKVHSTKRLVKCQSMKLSNIIGGTGMTNYIITPADINHNPFTHTTLIVPCTTLTLTKNKLSEV